MDLHHVDLVPASPTYDAIVIGARCAGSPTAMLLARKGYRVLLLERAVFPSDVPRGHLIQAPGTALLKRWGLLDRVTASNCPPIPRLTLDVGPFALTSAAPLADEAASIYAPPHGILDQILAEAAVEAGAELREGFVVREVLMAGERVIGIRGQGKDGQPVTETARIVIGADGLHSLVARTVQAPQYHIKPNLTCAFFSYFSGLPVDGVTIYVRERRFFGVFPTNDALTCVAIQLPSAELDPFRRDIEGHFFQELEQHVPELAARVRAAKREERFLGVADIPNFFRKPYGPGWALVGDAGYHKDPYTGQGISDAFLAAELLSEALDAGWSGRRKLEDALFDYEQQRNEDALPKYELNCQLASLEPPPPEMQQLFGALMHNPAETTRFFGTIVGTVSIPEFFAPANLQRILAESGAQVSASQ
jgi:2-polyprenyl-6-methoxyphenol hydroxylase-like FAD-dependent oxidoreductase